MNTNYFFESIEDSVKEISQVKYFLTKLQNYASENKNHVFVIQAPLVKNQDKVYVYEYKYALVVLIAKKKILFINIGEEKDLESFETFQEEFIEDLGSISDRYKYKEKIGRPRTWRKVIEDFQLNDYIDNFDSLIDKITIDDEREQRLSELLISLLTGSINDIDKVDGLNIQSNILDKIKKKIILFDSNQTNFLYQNKKQKTIVIQGLSGTGKTELLLHKLKELYLESEENKIFFTCYNKILAINLRERIPRFFNFMQVAQQIDWDKRLWCSNAWGSASNKNSGIYSYICNFYKIPFLTYGNEPSFSKVCEIAINSIKNNPENSNKFAFDYVLIDESQDFDEKFFELCDLVTNKAVYIAGDIFQSIFGKQEIHKNVDYLLNQCYRTDPKTLMFSHGLSMGLFEEEKLQWLTDEQWKQYGYLYEHKNEQYTFTREPIRRFEDLQENNESSIDLINITDLNKIDVANIIANQILKIKSSNPSVKPDDIAIILIEKNRAYNNSMLNYIGKKLSDNGIDWNINPAFETKLQMENCLCVTNFNNVKGLEFPFVICVLPDEIKNDLRKRNAIYMAMTRSFLHSSLLMPIPNIDIYDSYNKFLNEIKETGKMTITEPTDENKQRIQRINLEFDNTNAVSFREIVLSELNELSKEFALKADKEWYIEGVLSACGEIYDRKQIQKALKRLNLVVNLGDES